MQASPQTVSDKARLKAAWISFGASIFVFAMKIAAYRLTQSQAVLSDALESIVNVIAAAVALWVMRFVSEPADAEHPYGHGKMEYFSAAFEGGMIFFAALMIIVEAVNALINGKQSHQLEVGLIIISVAAVFNLLLGYYLKKTGEKEKSEALRASGVHVLSDVWTTAGVIVGLALVLITGWSWLDPIVAILVGLNLAYEGFKIVRKSIGSLIDEMDPEILMDLAGSLEANRVPGIIDIHQVRTIRSGRFHHIDAHLVVPEYWDVAHTHAVCHEFEKSVVQDYAFDGEIAFHIDPCKRAYCRICEVDHCPIRRSAFEKHRTFTVENLIGGPQPTESAEM